MNQPSMRRDEGRNRTDDSRIQKNTAPVQSVRFALPKGSRDLIIAIVMAAAVLTILIESYLLFDAYRAIKTQVWLKQDKEEEKFQKFVAGPYAQLAGELRANEILFEKQCTKEKGK